MTDQTQILRERIARDYGVALHLVPPPRVIEAGKSGYVELTRRQMIDRKFRMMGRMAKMQALLRREGRL